MKITKKQLKTLIESYLLNEALHDNVASQTGLTDPERIEQIRIASEPPHKLKKPDLLWIAKYFLTPEGMTTEEPVEDIVASIKSLKQHSAALQRRGASSRLQDYSSPGEINIAVTLSQGFLEEAQLGDEADILYEDDNWTLYMPHTREASCTIGRGTTWCTAIPGSGNNLFYNYILRGEAILYYLKRKGVVNVENLQPDDLFCLGTIGERIAFPEEGRGAGGIVVDARNQGLTKKRFLQVMGEQLGNDIIQTVEISTRSLRNKHPGKSKIFEMMKNPLLYDVEMRGKSRDVVFDLTSIMLELYALEVGKVKTSKEDEELIISVITNPENELNKLIAQKTAITAKDISKLDSAISSSDMDAIEKYGKIYTDADAINEIERNFLGSNYSESDLLFCKGKEFLVKAIPSYLYKKAEKFAQEIANDWVNYIQTGYLGEYGEVERHEDVEGKIEEMIEYDQGYFDWKNKFKRAFKEMLSVLIANALFDNGYFLATEGDWDGVETVQDFMSKTGELIWFPDGHSLSDYITQQNFRAQGNIEFMRNNRYYPEGFADWCIAQGFTFE